MMTLSPQVNTALRMLGDAGYEAFLVGGAVRDYVMGKNEAKDWDITTNALPQEVEAVFAAYSIVETGLKHGTVTVIIGGEPLEITTYRVDGDYTDHRRPDGVSFTRSLKEDLARRDFTMNALAYHPDTGIVDYHGGAEDISRRIVRCVGDPDRRFGEDALRILRGIRFAAVHDMSIEEATSAAIHRNKGLLRHIAAERVRVELTKMLCGSAADRILRTYADVIAVCIPDLAAMFGFEQHNPHHDRDVWAHTIAAVSGIPPQPVLRWAALLHDVGKPLCFSLGDDGVGHFYGHAGKSTQIADAVLSGLRFDTAGRERITKLIRYHDLPIPPEKKPVKRLLSKLGEETLRQLIALHIADTRGQSAICRHRVGEYQQVEAVLDEILAEEACFSLKDLAVNGGDMLALGLHGRAVGAALQLCLDAVIDEAVPNEKAALMAYISDEAARERAWKAVERC